MHRTILLSWLLILLSNGLWGQIDTVHLNTYLWEYPLQDSLVPDQDLVDELIREMDQIVASGDLFFRPISNDFSDQIWDHYYLYLEPGRVLQTVAMAYPYVSHTVQDTLRNMVAQLLSNTVHRPWAPNPLPLNQGKQRTTYTSATLWGSGSSFGLYRPTIQNVYSVWLYAYRTGDTLTVQPHYNALKSFYNNKVGGNHDKGRVYGTMNAHVGMARLARMFQDEPQVTIARNNLNNALNFGLQIDAVDTLARYGTQGWNGAYASAYDNRNIHWVNLNYIFLDLSPEIARYLLQYLPAQTTARHLQYLNRFPLWWLRQAPYFNRWTGDEGIGIPSNTFGINMPLERWVMQRDFHTLSTYMLSAPTGIADSYWIEALVLAIESKGHDVWVDVRNTPFVTNLQLPIYQMVAHAFPSNSGTITGTGTYTHGDTVVLEAFAQPGYSFVRWTENGAEVSTHAIYTFTANSHRTLQAHFSNNLLFCNNLTLFLDTTGVTTTTASAALQNPPPNLFSVSMSQTTFDCSHSGLNHVTLLVTDANYNTSTCTIFIDVRDTLPPVVAINPATLQLDSNGIQTLIAGMVGGSSFDNCGIASYALDQNHFGCADLGKTVVTLTITDLFGNQASASTNITVVDDIAPTIACPNLTVPLVVNSGCHFLVSGSSLDATGWDNCSYSITHNHLHSSDVTLAGALFPIGITTIVWTIADASGNSASCISEVLVEGFSINGGINYYNSWLTPMANIDITLTQGSVMYTTTTDLTGSYYFSNTCPGTYTVGLTTTIPPGGINATDAGQINAWGTASVKAPIERIRFMAGDVTNDGHLLSNDAGRVLMYFVTAGNPPFSGNNWKLWSQGQLINSNSQIVSPLTITVNSNHFENFYAMATGDFNRSFIPGISKSGANVQLNYLNALQRDADDLVLLPIIAGQDMEVAALSLILKYPFDKVEIKDVLSGSQNMVLQYTVNNETLRIGWHDQDPIYWIKNDTLLFIMVQTSANLTDGDQIVFSLVQDPQVELANGNHQIIDGAKLLMNTIGTPISTSSMPNSEQGLLLKSTPNPFRHSTEFSYTIPYDGLVVLAVYDLLGRKIAEPVNQTQIPGSYSILIDNLNLSPGVYTVILRLIDTEMPMIQTIKIVNMR